MAIRNPLGLLLAALLVAPPLSAQAHEHGAHTSPYTDLQDREIKALSDEDVAGLLGGAGMELALPAELNGYPGPRHVLDMADMLELTDDQRTAVQGIFDRMQAEARTLGARIVEAERRLDRAFAAGVIDAAALSEIAGTIAAERGALRVAHLKAHLEVTPLLTDEQRAHYATARGYGGNE